MRSVVVLVCLWLAGRRAPAHVYPADHNPLHCDKGDSCPELAR